LARRIYFDNAATSFPKPQQVHDEMNRYASQIGASAGRGAYREAVETGEIIRQVRSRIARMLGVSCSESIIMTFNCTDGLSLAIKGLLRAAVHEAGVHEGRVPHVVTTRMEHNSVLRPLHALQRELGIEVSYVSADGQGLVDPDDIRVAIKSNTVLIALVHGSNVCGSMQDVAAVGEISQEHGITYLVDAAQTMGHVPVKADEMHADLIAFPGHKGLLGPLGTGALYIRPGLEEKIEPLKEGGTGSKSELPEQPDFLPDRFEAGSHNALGIAGLNAGLEYVEQQGIEKFRNHELELCRVFLEKTSEISGLGVYGPGDPGKRVGVFSVNMEGLEPGELAAVLEEQFGLLTRPGLHCAPFAHQAIGTFEQGGTVRFSFGPFITVEDVEYACESLGRIAQLAVR